MQEHNKLLGLVFICFICIGGLYLNNFTARAKDFFAQNESDIYFSQENILLPMSQPPQPKILKTIRVIVTAYSSCPFETDDTPFITASGKHVQDGIIANNLLRFGSTVRLPELFNDKIFVVEDRMHSRKGDNHFDIWFPSKQEAIEFGVKITTLEVLAN